MNFNFPPTTPIVRSDVNASADDIRSSLRKYGANSPSIGARVSIEPVIASVNERTARLIAKPTCPNTSRSEEHTSELQSLMRISYAVFRLTKTTRSTNYHSIQFAHV